MKNFTKICLIIGGILGSVGLICCIAAACMGFSRLRLRNLVEDGTLSLGPERLTRFLDFDWDYDIDWDSDDSWYEYGGEDMKWTIDSDKLESKWTTDGHSYDPSEIKKIDIEYGFGTVRIEESDSGKIEIESNYRSVWGNYSRSIKCGLDGSTLKIRDKSDKKIFRMKHGINDASLVIRLPKGCSFDKADLEFGAADVKLRTPIQADKVEIIIGAGMLEGDFSDTLVEADELILDVGAGEMNISGLKARKLDAECGVGLLTMKDVSMEKCELECGIGKLQMNVDGRQEDFDYEIDCGIGNVVLGDSSYTGLGTSKNIDNNADRKMDIDCGIGQVVVSFQE